jgi:thioredoxin reductase (NADPH)
VVRSGHLAASMSAYLTRRIAAADNVHLTTHAEVAAVHGEDWLRGVDLRDTRDGTVRRVEAAAMFVCIGGHPRTSGRPQPGWPSTRRATCSPAATSWTAT